MANIPSQVFSVNLIMDAMVDSLATHLIDEVVSDQDSLSTGDADAVAGLIRKGKLQDDPTIAEINILVHPGNDEWPHILYDKHQMNGFELPTVYEIGNGTGVSPFFYVRRFIVELRLFFEGEQDREVAQVKSNVVLGRAEYAIHQMNHNSIIRKIPVDSFGEKLFEIQTRKSYISEGGGTGTFVWRGKLFVEGVTSKSPRNI